MTEKSDFNAEEWAALTEGPLMAGMRVVAAERGGTLRESLAVGRAYTEARKQHGDCPLLDAVVATPPALDPARLREGGGDIKQVADKRLTEAVGVVEAKATPAEVSSYKQFVVTVAEAVANANKEGGFAGIGGKPVSDSEQKAIDEVRSILGLAS